MFQGDSYVSLLVPCFDIPVCLDNLVERVDSINDWCERACLDQFFDHQQLFELFPEVCVDENV
ncbi:MAG TPA: hypothetical protein VD969_17630 [Symbiobacteriaceae bacterium]|nr:hypothetical protein [Symbiobacteriaceae bacterium]